jgi:hypothetical protein
MRILGVAGLAAALMPLVASQPLGAEDRWVPLFNGSDLSGWVQRGGKARYLVDGNELIGRAVPGTPNSFLCTSRNYTNFILEVEFKPCPSLNSGIQVRSEASAAPYKVVWKGKTNSIPAGRVHGYQVEIDPSSRAWTGGIYDESRRGWMADLKTNDTARAAFRMGEWNRFRIECQGDVLKTYLNGIPAAELKDSMTSAGFIALQVHSVGKNTNQLEMRWRNIRIQELR